MAVQRKYTKTEKETNCIVKSWNALPGLGFKSNWLM